MVDAWAVALAVAVSAGALAARPVPLWIGVAVLVVGFGWRRPALVCAGGLVLASSLGARAWTGTAPMPAQAVDQVVTLLNDPEDIAGGTRAIVELDDRRVELWARGSGGATLGRRLAGERVYVRGEAGPPPGLVARRLAVRHVVGRLDAEFVGDWSTGTPATRSANRLRRTLEKGARSMAPAERALFTGFVIGDDRAQPPEIVDDFRASGLAHLTAVSGQNVALLLAVAAPLLRRLRLGTRWAVTVALVGWFALLTRFEPSVLRASAMAVLAVTAFAAGRPASAIRLLALCVAGMMLIDPLLVHSVGWWMSVGATAGIVLGAPPVAAVLPGPRWLATAIAVTTTAQLGVAPVSAAVFGGIPVSSLPANLLAAPATTPVMVWGLPAGVVAGWLPDPLAAALHMPTRLCVRWLALVARVAARAPLGQLQAPHLVVLVLGLTLAVLAARRRRTARTGGDGGPNAVDVGRSPASSTAASTVEGAERLSSRTAPTLADDAATVDTASPGTGAATPGATGRPPRWTTVATAGAGGCVLAALLSAALAASATVPADGLAVPGGRLWRSGGASVLVVATGGRDLVAALRQAGAGQLDVLVVTSGPGRDPGALDAVLRRHQPRLVLAPASSRVRGARSAPPGTQVAAGALAVDVVGSDPFEVRVHAAPAG